MFNRWFDKVMRRVHGTHPFLEDQRDLGNPAVLRGNPSISNKKIFYFYITIHSINKFFQAFFEKAHQATMRNERSSGLYDSWMQDYIARYDIFF